MFIPTELVVGDSFTWNDFATKDNRGNVISSNEWTLSYVLNGSSKLTLTSTPNGSGWSTTITSDQSAGLTAGDFYWQAFVTKGTDRVTIGSGKITLKANLSTATAGHDARSQLRKDLEAVQSAIRTMISGGAVQEYAINNRSIKKMALGELRAYESQLKAQVAREERNDKIKNGLGDPNNLKIRFR